MNGVRILPGRARDAFAGGAQPARRAFHIQRASLRRGALSSDFYRDVFLKYFVCRMSIFGFLDLKKDHRQQHEFAASEFQPGVVRQPASRVRPFSGRGHIARARTAGPWKTAAASAWP